MTVTILLLLCQLGKRGVDCVGFHISLGIQPKLTNFVLLSSILHRLLLGASGKTEQKTTTTSATTTSSSFDFFLQSMNAFGATRVGTGTGHAMKRRQQPLQF